MMDERMTSCRPHHSLYWSFQSAFHPSGTLGGGGPEGGTKSAMVEESVARIDR